MITIKTSYSNSVRVEVKIIGASSSLVWEQLQCQTRLDLIKVLNILWEPVPFFAGDRLYQLYNLL